MATKGHKIISSASLIPENDPTTLFTGSGMQPMVPYLLGATHPLGSRIADSQKSFRAQDVEEVGDNRHTTFFEMLGNWSLGDYFKNEQIPWMFEFLTSELDLDPKRLYVTCFRGNEDLGIPRDEESAKLWQDQFAAVGIDDKIVDFSEKYGLMGLPGAASSEPGRIFYYNEKKNWWSRSGVPANMPAGEPGGPDSEMFWDFGVELKMHENSPFKDKPCHVNCDCGRFMEIGNNVFMEYVKTENGFEKLKQRNVDFGGGLERMAAAVQNDPDVFKIDLFEKMRDKLAELSGQPYGLNEKLNYSYRVCLDHLRAATFLIGDGAVPSNKDQGYFTRRLIRRAVRFADSLGIKENFCVAIGEAVIGTYAEAYTVLNDKKDMILDELNKEEIKFRRTLVAGLKEFESKIINYKTGQTLEGKLVFDLYQSYGFPIEVTEELAKEKGLMVDVDGIKEELKKHQDLSRAGSEQKFKGGLADTGEISTKYHTATHLLHAALRKVLGEHAEQRGSNITAERLRFDFSHPQKMTPEEIKQVEDLVNGAIQRDYPVSFSVTTVEEAKQKGAIGLFESKYGDQVKVYTVGNVDAPAVADPSADTFSKEICGGPHVERTGVLGHFKIVKEEASSAGVRRIKAVLE